VAALTQLGYNQADAMRALDSVPQELRTTEERVHAALRSL
jgi:Holliday junction resolvasome RuvABC DNA-binding subunit